MHLSRRLDGEGRRRRCSCRLDPGDGRLRAEDRDLRRDDGAAHDGDDPEPDDDAHPRRPQPRRSDHARRGEVPLRGGESHVPFGDAATGRRRQADGSRRAPGARDAVGRDLAELRCERTQVGGELRQRGALPRVLLEAPKDRRLEAGWGIGTNLPETHRCVGDDAREHTGDGGGLERHPAGEELVEDYA